MVEAQLQTQHSARLTSRVPLRGVLEITALMWIYAAYGVLRNLATSSPTVAWRHADEIVHVERRFDLDWGQRVRNATHAWTWLSTAANIVYASHVVAPVIVLAALWRFRPGSYARWRNTFLVMLAIGLVGFWLFPVMPPRILSASYRFVDTSHRLFVGRTPLPGVVVPDPNRLNVLGFSNPYAAMPSLHVAWALFAALACWPLTNRRWARCLVMLYPVAMFLAVLITADHWLLDRLAGCLTVMLAYGIVRGFETLRARRSDIAP